MRVSDFLCYNCGERAAHVHHAIPRSMCPEGVDEPLNFLMLCTGCHTGWHDRTVTICRDVFAPEQWAWVTAHARAQWLNDWYPGRQLNLPF